MDRQDVSVTLPWMGAGTEFFNRVVEALPDDALRAPSALPDWSRAHVVAHVARNAEALTRLATWARTGVETPMYPSREVRGEEIESSAQAPAETLRRELLTTAEELDAALAALDAQTWQAGVRSAVGRPIPAAEVPWMRVREVWLHAVDLDAGASVGELPPEVVDALLDDAVPVLSAREGCPAARLAPTDRDRTWALGSAAGTEAPGLDAPGIEVQGAAADVLGWLVGRGGTDALVARDAEGATTAVPPAPHWL